jgi:predicted aconitase
LRRDTDLKLSEHDLASLHGDLGSGAALAMGLLVAIASTDGAGSFIDIVGAHIDGCLFHGRAGTDFVRALVDGGSQVKVPTTLNVSSLDLLHPDLYRGSESTAEAARELMDLHVALGCAPTWTCAPYQLPDRPKLGSQIAWGESNAIVFANSVLGARTNRYGDFADLACAVTGRAPATGLHTDVGRLADVVVELDVPDSVFAHDIFYPLLGFWLGANTGNGIAAIVGLPPEATEDDLKALGAAAASSGSTAMFHAVGITPEAPSLRECVKGIDLPMLSVGIDDLRDARARLGTGEGVAGAVSVGTPHLSSQELEKLSALTAGRRACVPFYVNTGRNVLDGASTAAITSLEAFGATIVTDTCTYITPIIGPVDGPVLTNSGKWAYYAPANLGVDVVFAGLAECVEAALTGRIKLSDPFLAP